MPSAATATEAASSQPVAPGTAKVLLVAWESCDWDLLTPLIEADQLPTVSGLLARGVLADLHSLDSAEPALLWTSLATGLRPERHGVLDRLARDPTSGELRPAGLVDSSEPSVWALLSSVGVSCHAVNWFGSHPVEPLSGVAVSDRFRLITGPLQSSWPPAKGSVLPEDRLEDLACRRCHPSVLKAEDLAPYIRDLAAINLDQDRRPLEIATVLAETASVQAAARWLLENEPWRFLAVRFHAVASIYRRFQCIGSSSTYDQHHYGRVLTSVLRLHDRMLADLLELAGKDVTVLLVSEQGVVTVDPWRRQSGLLAMAGPGVRSDQLLERAHLLDVVPTVLQLFGFAAPDVNEGSVLLQALEESIAAAPLLPLSMPPQSQPAAVVGRQLLQQQEAVAQVLAQGLPLFSPAEQTLQQSHQRRKEFNRVLLLIEAGDWQSATRILEQLADDAEAPPGLLLLHAYGLLHCGDLPGASRATAVARRKGGISVLVLVLEALIAMGRQQLVVALHRLEEAELLKESDSFAQGRLGLAWLQLGRLDRAEHHLRQSLERQPGDAPLRVMLAAVLVDRQRPREGLEEVGRALLHLDHSADAHAVAAQALLGCGWKDAASEAYRRALARASSPPQRDRITAALLALGLET
jgi:tetratricopeptide (TPR) repeat protein